MMGDAKLVQFYFLSVMLNLLVGIMLAFNENSVVSKIIDTKDRLFQLIVGLLALFVALIKMLSPMDGIPFFGDFLPFLAGLLGGASVLIQYFSTRSSEELVLPGFVQVVFVEGKLYIGAGCIFVSVLHFVFPFVLFL